MNGGNIRADLVIADLYAVRNQKRIDGNCEDQEAP